MADLLDEIGVQRGDCVAVVGAGGKTTLCWRMVQAFAARGERVVFTTTTKIWQPAIGAFDVMRLLPLPSGEGRGEGDWLTMCIASGVEGERSNAPVPNAIMPTVQTKLVGFSPAAICTLKGSDGMQSASFVVEADGARGLLLKAPAAYEPAIPSCADVVCVVACLDAIGRPLDERTVHRVERVSHITGAMRGNLITASMIVAMLCHAEGGMKNMPAQAQRVAVLTQRGAGAPHADAEWMLGELRNRGYHRAVLCEW